MTRAAAIVILASAAAAWPAAQTQRPQFRAFTDLVTVDVSVRRGNNAVTGLTAADFRVTDSGVPQTIELLEMDALPLDVTIVVDTSGSMLDLIEPIREHARTSARLLRTGDRVRLMSFADTVSQVSGFQPAGPDYEPPTLVEGQATSLYDGLVAALVPPREGDRRHLVIAFTDGFDTMSVLNSEALGEVGRRADSVLHAFYVMRSGTGPVTTVQPPPLPHLNTRRIWSPAVFEDAFFPMRDVARDTGGQMETLYATKFMPDKLREAIEDFRTSYVIRYRATGVPREGWHPIEVTLTKRAPYKLRARRGYFGS